MIAALMVASSMCGLVAVHLLFRKVRFVPISAAGSLSDLAIIIPARDEEKNIATLLASIRQGSLQPAELIVVDDASSDETAAVASGFGARVVRSMPKPADWKGKPWACWQGANSAQSDILLFLDADTRLEQDALARIRHMHRRLPGGQALSILPFHVTQEPYEELSLFFNILLAGGAGGFSGFDEARLFGQTLLIDKDLYFKAGGHRAVKEHVLENLHLSFLIRQSHGNIQTALGYGAITMRMFPDGISQLISSWRKGFADGAKLTSRLAMFTSIVWLSGLLSPILSIPFCHGATGLLCLMLYLVNVLSIWSIARRLGSFRFLSAVVYPVPLLFYLVIFAIASLAPAGAVRWKGREV